MLPGQPPSKAPGKLPDQLPAERSPPANLLSLGGVSRPSPAVEADPGLALAALHSAASGGGYAGRPLVAGPVGPVGGPPLDAQLRLSLIERAMAEQFCEPIKKLCKICGDKAAYHNYGVLTCDSCKTFFRRQIIDKKVRSTAVRWRHFISG